MIILGGNRDPCSFNGLALYSFDFAQQAHYPSNPIKQPGPIYFKTPKENVAYLLFILSLINLVNF